MTVCPEYSIHTPLSSATDSINGDRSNRKRQRKPQTSVLEFVAAILDFFPCAAAVSSREARDGQTLIVSIT